MKKLLSVLLAGVMTASMLVGCGSTTDTASTEEATEATGTVAADKVYNIGICQLVEHVALDAATKGFEDALTEKLGEDHVNFDFQNAQGEQTNATTIVNAFVASNVDLILANATSPLAAAASATQDIPILGTSVTDYATALDMEGFTGATGRNISGTSDLAPIEEQAAMLVELFPDAKNVGMLYCSAEANSKFQIDKFKAAMDTYGITATEYSIADTNDIQTVVTQAAEACDVLYIPTDNTMANNTEAVDNICRPAGVPIICGEEGICSGCGVATLSISYYDLGYATGEMAYEILVNGADVSTMEIKYAPNVVKEYNEEICNELGVKIPEDYVAIATE
ncbi:MAG: ABC transporter substrate-binding protein [Lachnospiraceae bacterium]|nr:ABC transporter substrate-binding protein [Lachnospiraceae bacterium]